MKELNIPSANNSSFNPVDTLVQHYSDLIDRITAKMSAYAPLKLIETPAPKDLPRWKRIFFTLLSPYQMFETVDLRSIIPSMIWFMFFLIWVAWIIVILNFLFGKSIATTSNVSNAQPPLIFSSLIVIGLLIAPINYRTAVNLLRNKSIHWIWRVIWFSALTVELYEIFHQVMQSYPNASLSVFNTLGKVIVLILFLLWLMIPSAIYIVTFASYMLLCGYKFLKFILDYFISSHRPYAFSFLKELVYEPLGQNDLVWRLIDLNTEELEALRDWSTENREGTEKRLVPATILFTAAAVFANAIQLASLLHKIWRFFSSPWIESLKSSSPFSISVKSLAIMYLITPFSITIIFLLLVAYLLLFHNLVVQSYLVEACTIAKFGVEEKNRVVLQNRPDQYGSKKNWVQRLLDFWS